MTEALAVVDALRTASSQSVLTNESSLTLDMPLKSGRKVLSLKMALFNLQKYIKEGDFVVEFMIKGGLKLLIGLLERRAGGLTGNSLAVSRRVYLASKPKLLNFSTLCKESVASSSSTRVGQT
jgi:engulfment/cell motility protein 1